MILNQGSKWRNIASVLFEEQEGSFLAATLVALGDHRQKGKVSGNAEKVIGVIGGTKTAGIDKFIVGYIQGASAATRTSR